MLVDIFCRVLNNYGDIGFCWRLSQQLLLNNQIWKIRIWVDNLVSFSKIQPEVNIKKYYQTAMDIEIIWWNKNNPYIKNILPGDIIIETFQCNPPKSFIEAMRNKRLIWIHIEYLTAEPWIDKYHGLTSLNSYGFKKIFFFPGFSKSSGGLIREDFLSQRRDELQNSWPMQEEFLKNLGIRNSIIENRRSGTFLCTLFCYPKAPVNELINILEKKQTPTILLIPKGVVPNIENKCLPSNKVKIIRIPFVSQSDFDRVLWCSDLNFVRGEDSLIRAIWAARPLVWNIYEQKEKIHFKKLDAWLNKYPVPLSVKKFIRAWNKREIKIMHDSLKESLLINWKRWLKSSKDWDKKLASQTELSRNLEQFFFKNKNPDNFNKYN
ncbi:MAG: elongation factor P maturation arginine rhamnosyltransferase EarP [Bordetella sp.]|nr:MAG: elongation factor P maturation arginine rhamnosyltransferase EarP [Bordetella sp.]